MNSRRRTLYEQLSQSSDWCVPAVGGALSQASCTWPPKAPRFISVKFPFACCVACRTVESGTGTAVTGICGEAGKGGAWLAAPSVRGWMAVCPMARPGCMIAATAAARMMLRSEEHTSELQSLMRISYAVFCLKKKKKKRKKKYKNHVTHKHITTQKRHIDC